MSYFGTVIHSYSRADAIRDGVLVDLTTDFADVCRDAGISVPVAATRSVFDRYIALTPSATEMGCDTTGRAWDALYMFNMACQGIGDVTPLGASSLLYKIACVVDGHSAEEVQIKAVIGPGDDYSPVLTLMLPTED